MMRITIANLEAKVAFSQQILTGNKKKLICSCIKSPSKPCYSFLPFTLANRDFQTSFSHAVSFSF